MPKIIKTGKKMSKINCQIIGKILKSVKTCPETVLNRIQNDNKFHKTAKASEELFGNCPKIIITARYIK